MLYYDSKVFYSLLVLQQLEVVSPYATFTCFCEKTIWLHTIFIFVKFSNKIDVVTIEYIFLLSILMSNIQWLEQ